MGLRVGYLRVSLMKVSVPEAQSMYSACGSGAAGSSRFIRPGGMVSGAGSNLWGAM